MGMKNHLLKFGGRAPKAILSKSPLRRCVWLLIFLCAWAMFVAQTYLVCDRYFSYPKRVSVELVSEGVPFPSITLCRMGGLEFYVLCRLKEKELLRSKSHKIDVHSSSVRNHSNSVDDFVDNWIATNRVMANHYVEYMKRLMVESLDVMNPSSHADSLGKIPVDRHLLNELTSSSTMLANIGQEEISKVATKLEKFVVSCKYERKDCD